MDNLNFFAGAFDEVLGGLILITVFLVYRHHGLLRSLKVLHEVYGILAVLVVTLYLCILENHSLEGRLLFILPFLFLVILSARIVISSLGNMEKVIRLFGGVRTDLFKQENLYKTVIDHSPY